MEKYKLINDAIHENFQVELSSSFNKDGANSVILGSEQKNWKMNNFWTDKN